MRAGLCEDALNFVDDATPVPPIAIERGSRKVRYPLSATLL